MKMRCLFTLLAAASWAAAMPGCAAPAHSQLPHAECLVCKYNADLACVDVEVGPTTPRYVYDGKTYFFCSEECRAAFAKDPPKYLPSQ